jgi:hypothetical protein
VIWWMSSTISRMRDTTCVLLHRIIDSKFL